MTEPRSGQEVAPHGLPGPNRRAPGAPNPLRLRFRPGAALTDAMFAALAAANPDLRLERTALGELEVMSPAGMGASHRNFLLNYRLGHWGENQGRGLGLFFDSSGGFTLPNTAIRSPDAAWVSRARWEAISEEEQEEFSRVCPDFVVELRSRTDAKGRPRRKLREYVAQGARLGWLIDPKTGAIEIYRPGRPVETLTRPESLSGEDVLPGLLLDLNGILGD